MNELKIEKTYRVLLGDVTRFRILIVGAGGTGSALASLLASLAYHAGLSIQRPGFKSRQGHMFILYF